MCVIAATGSTWLNGCKGRDTTSATSFVGKWKSSKLTTPIYLYANGEWEIKKDDGSVLQYGIWDYKDGFVIWGFKLGSDVGRDANAVESVGLQVFRLRENGSVTSFERLE